MTDQQKREILLNMIRQYEYEQFDTQLRAELFTNMGEPDRAKQFEDNYVKVSKAVAFLKDRLTEFPEPTV